MLDLNDRSLRNSPFYFAVMLIQTVENERDVFDRVVKLRGYNAFGGVLFAFFVLLQATHIELPVQSLRPIIVNGTLVGLLLSYSLYQMLLRKRVIREDRYMARDIYELFGPPLVGAAIMGFAVPAIIIVSTLAAFAGSGKWPNLLIGTLALMLLGIPISCIHFYFGQKIYRVYRDALTLLVRGGQSSTPDLPQ